MQTTTLILILNNLILIPINILVILDDAFPPMSTLQFLQTTIPRSMLRSHTLIVSDSHTSIRDHTPARTHVLTWNSTLLGFP